MLPRCSPVPGPPSNISPEGRVGGAKAAVRRASSRREPRQSCEEIPKIPPPLGVGQTPWWHGYVTTFGLIETHPDRDALSTSRAAAPSSPERCSDLRARLLDTMMLLLATTCFVHAHDVSQGRSRRASRRAVCLTPVIDAAEGNLVGCVRLCCISVDELPAAGAVENCRRRRRSS